MKISGWGRYPRVEARGAHFETRGQLAAALMDCRDCIAHACGRSYGDSALNERVIFTRRFDKMLDFDRTRGILACQSGVTLGEIVEIFVPRGWFLRVTPGTQYVSVGGAIAGDVHGKNHHRVGCFSESVLALELMLPSGEAVHCSRKDRPELFRATCGGMGLTGVILEARLQLQPIKSAYMRERVFRCANLREVFHRFQEHHHSSYSVAWIDCLGKGVDRGRSVLILGEHADSGKLQLPLRRSPSIPFALPTWLLNRHSVALFNHIYYHRHPASREGRLVPLDSFFYPLDRIEHWNRLYGSKGFAQYQVVIPKEASEYGLTLLLDRIARSGLGSFLGVLKLFGPGNDNLLSFPMEGYTLALDFRIHKRLFPLLDELDRVVLDCGGRGYLCKDARMSRATFRKGYPEWEGFHELRHKYDMHRKFRSLQARRLGV